MIDGLTVRLYKDKCPDTIFTSAETNFGSNRISNMVSSGVIMIKFGQFSNPSLVLTTTKYKVF